MAAELNTTLTFEETHQLADRLAGHAQQIVNAAQVGIMNDLLLAARALLSATARHRTLCREIARAAAACSDKRAGARLLEIIGVAAD